MIGSRRVGRVRWALRAMALSGCCVAAVASDPVSDVPPLAMHADADAIERALLDGFRGYIRGDVAAVREALDAVERGCRRVSSTDIPTVPKEIVNWDIAFHRGLAAAREGAARGDIERAYDQLRWLPKGCRGCHEDHARIAAGDAPAGP